MANPAMFTWLDRARVALDLSRFALTEPIDAVAGAGVYSTIETHTAGMPTRIVTHGVGVLPGATMLERMQYLQHSDDDVRRLLMYEPRGHSAMCGAIIQPPLQPDTDVGLLFICAGGHLPMCGHAAIGVSTALVASGAIARTGPITTVRLDTPAGVIGGEVELAGGKVSSVTIRNMVARSVALDVPIDLPRGSIQCDLAAAGSLYAIVSVDAVGAVLSVDGLPKLIVIGREIMEVLDRDSRVSGAEADHALPRCEHVVFYEGSIAGREHHSVTVHKGFVDRSPCGTGTSAYMATMHARGALKPDQKMANRTLNGSKFSGQITEVRENREQSEIICALTGSAWITGFATYVLDPDDPFSNGFSWGPS